MKTGHKIIPFILLTLISCANENKQIESVEIAEISDEPLENYGKIIKQAYSVIVDSDEYPLSSVKDGEVVDSTCYILDYSMSISAINLNTGKVSKQIRKIGNAEGEYISPTSITSDGKNIYVLDNGRQQIVTYDMTLTPTGNMAIDSYGMELTKIEDGFLLFSIEGKERSPIIVHIDNDGKTIGKQKVSEMSIYELMEEKRFKKDEKDNVYFKPPFSNTLYTWNGKEFVPCLRFDFGEHSIPEHITSTTDISASRFFFPSDFFVTTSGFIISFANDNCLCFAYKRFDEKKAHTGIMPQLNDSIPFCPKWQNKNTLVGIEEEETESGFRFVLYVYRLY